MCDTNTNNSNVPELTNDDILLIDDLNKDELQRDEIAQVIS